MVKFCNLLFGQVSDFDICLLCIFKIIVECGSFFVVESIFGFSCLVISLYMGDLEKCLGMCLCQCGCVGFVLIDEGCEVYCVIQILLVVLEGFCVEVNDLYQYLCGEFNIGIINNLVILLQMCIIYVFSVFKGQGLQVWINIGMIIFNEIELGVFDGYLYVGVVLLISLLLGFEYLLLYDEYVQFYCSCGYVLFECVDGDIVVDEVFVVDVVVFSYCLFVEVQVCYQELNNSVSVLDCEGMVFLILIGNFIGYLLLYYVVDWVVVGMLWFLLLECFYYVIVLIIVICKGCWLNLVLECFLEVVVVL